MRGRVARTFSRALVASVALAALFGAESASAGTYVATECSTLNPSAADAVSSTNTTVYPRTTDCSETDEGDVGMQVTNTGGVGSSYAYGVWSFPAPSGAVFSEVAFQFKLVNAGGHGASVAIPGAGTWRTPPYPAGWNSIVTVPIIGRAFNLWLECPGNCTPAPGGQAAAYARNLYFTISDGTKPQVIALSGALVSGGVRRGSESISVSATDNASLAGVTVKANGVVIEERQTACDLIPNGPARSFKPCPTFANWNIPVNTETLPDGENSIEACVHDLSFDPRARNSTCETRTIQVDNSCPSSGGTEATAIGAVLQSGNGLPADAIRVRSDRGATARGTLDGPGNVAGSTVCLYENVDLPGDGRELVDTAKVRNDGSFALDVDPGPSRLFDVVYRYDDAVREEEGLRLESVVVPTFKVVGRKMLHNGQNVRFRGRIPGPNADGRGISLQARAGRKWRTFKQVRADSRGEFRGLYRFTQTFGLAQYTFRARVKKQGNYPYSPGHSLLRMVTVRG